MKTIINSKCAISSCHISGSTLGDLSNYQSLKQQVDEGTIRSRVFEMKIMPPANAQQLTNEEKEIIQCWLDNDAPKS